MLFAEVKRIVSKGVFLGKRNKVKEHMLHHPYLPNINGKERLPKKWIHETPMDILVMMMQGRKVADLKILTECPQTRGLMAFGVFEMTSLP